MKTTVKSTNDIKKIFPELTSNNKFKKKVDEVFKAGYSFEVTTVDDPWKFFILQSGKKYKACISFKEKKTWFKRAKVTEMSASLESYNAHPEIYRNIDMARITATFLNQETGEWTPHYACDYQTIDSTTWVQMCSIIGKLIKDELIHYEHCPKCGGSGIIPYFMHVAEGVCFHCMGIGKWFVVTKKDVSTNE